MLVEAVKCDKCSKMYDASKPDYFTVRGNICFGEKGGIVGDNIKELGESITTVNSSHYCFGCLTAILQEATTQPRGLKSEPQVLTEATPPKVEKAVPTPKTATNKRTADEF
jgi:hypothetical protein